MILSDMRRRIMLDGKILAHPRIVETEGDLLLIHAHIERDDASGVGQSKAIKKPVEPIRGYAECCGKSLLGHFAIERAFPSGIDRKSTRLNSSHYCASRMPSSA